METIMNEIMTLCYRYTEMYNAEQRTKNCTEDEYQFFIKGYLLNKELFDIQYKKVQELISHRN